MNTNDLYDSKFLYYKKYIYHLVIVITFSSVAYYVSDCMLYGRLEFETLIPRIMVFLPTAAFIWAFKKSDNRVLISLLVYIVFHTVILGTIGACCTLPDLSFASDGFIILQFMFVAVGFTMPKKYTIIFQGLPFIEYLIAQPFVHFPELPMTFVLGIPVYIGSCAISIAMDRTYKDQFESKQALEFSISHDPLTGCYNRNLFVDASLGLIDDLKENHNDYAFLLFDLDNFKCINDTYGHNIGDEILTLVSNTVKNVIGEKDYFVRWGGEEFLVITKSTKEEAIELAKKMNKAVEIINYNDLPVTISIGIAVGDSDNHNESIRVADDAMYRAKATGKNKACW